jgi:predicted O-methyltransferase YrrM
MDAKLHETLEQLYREGREFDATQPDRLERRRNLEPDTAALLALIVQAISPKRLLELGTSNGYSTLWLADAARASKIEFTSVELEAQRVEQARTNLRQAGLEDHVHLRQADAAAVLSESPDDHWGVIFLDAERPYYAGYWPDLVRTLVPGGLLVVDNVISHADQVAEFRALVEADARVTEALAPTGAGALLILKLR